MMACQERPHQPLFLAEVANGWSSAIEYCRRHRSSWLHERRRGYWIFIPANRRLIARTCGAGDEAFRDTRLRLSQMAPPASPATDRAAASAPGGANAEAADVTAPPPIAPVPLDGVGGHVLLVKADVHREGFVFPSVLFDHQVETEGFAKMVKALGHQPYGLPGYVVHHAQVTVKPQPTWDRRLK